MNYTPDALAALDLEAGFPQQSVPEFVEIQLAESGGNPLDVGYDANGQTVQDTQGANATVPYTSYDAGLAQVNSSHNPNAAPGTYSLPWIQQQQNPLSNTKTALAISDEGTNFSAWSDDGVPAQGSWPVGTQALQDVLKGGNSYVASTPAGSTATSAGTSTDEGVPGNGLAAIKYTGFAGVLQSIAGILNPVPSTSGIIGDITGIFTGATESDIAVSIEAFTVRLFMAAAFAALGYIGVKTITSGNSRGTSGSTTILQSARSRNAATNAETAQADVARKAEQARLQYESAQQQRQHEANQARLARTAATRAANRQARTS